MRDSSPQEPAEKNKGNIEQVRKPAYNRSFASFNEEFFAMAECISTMGKALYVKPLANGTPNWPALIGDIISKVESSPDALASIIDISGIKDLPKEIMPEINRLLTHPKCGRCAILGAGFILKGVLKLWLSSKGHSHVELCADLDKAKNFLSA